MKNDKIVALFINTWHKKQADVRNTSWIHDSRSEKLSILKEKKSNKS